MTTEDKLEYFYKVTVENAEKKYKDSMEEYEKGLETVFLTHKEDALRKQELFLKLSKEDLKKEKNGEVSRQQLEIKRTLGKKQEELKEKLFLLVEEKLAAFRQTPEYEDYLVSLIEKAGEFARGEEMKLYIDPEDADKKALLEERTGEKLLISEESFLGGIRAFIHTGNILMDQSLKTGIAEARQEFTFDF